VIYPVNHPQAGDQKRLFLAIAGAILGPLIVYTIYILIGHVVLPRGRTWLDYLVAAVSIGTGITFLWRLPLSR